MRAIDLFAGAGGLSLGLQQAGIEVVAAVEWDTDACATYRANVGDHMIERSILDVSPDELPDCDLMAGGPPCQGFSFAGKRDPNDPRNQLWREYWRIVEAKQPAFILIENVRGMLAMGEDKPLILAFAELGYRVMPYLVNAADYGVPQRRFRVFYIGNRLGLPNPCPTATHAQPPRHLLLGLEPWVTVRQALGIGGQMTHKFGSTVESVDGSCGSPWFDGDAEPSRVMSTKGMGILDEPHHLLDQPSLAIRSGVHGQPGYSPRHESGFVPDYDTILDEPSSTIRFQNGGHDASPSRMAAQGILRPQGFVPLMMRDKHKDDGTRSVWYDASDTPSRVIGTDSRYEIADTPEMVLRRLTPRECATLQDFPPDFQFHGTKTSQYRQIGNAVPPGMARAIGLAIRAVLENASVDVA